MERKASKVINNKNYLSCILFELDFIKFVYLINSSLKKLEFFVLLIIGRNNPKMYNKIITRETISIALTAFIFIKITFLSVVETIQLSYMVCG